MHSLIERLCQRYKLAFSLAIFLCLGLPAHAIHASTISSIIEPKTSAISTSTASVTTTIKPSNKAISSQILITESIVNKGLIAATSVTEGNPSSDVNKASNEPSLYALLDAEFAANRDDTERALTIYKQQSFKQDATAVFERALSLSLRNDRVEESLQFAKAWQDDNPDHVPAWFYVAHLALRAHDYELAGETLNRILSYDPRADLSEILIGIYPNSDEDKRELLAALQPIDSEQNASLSVLKAGLLYQFDEPEIAIVHINRALERQPDYVPFITLKADILRKIEPSAAVLEYLSQARLRNADSKNLYL